MQRRPQSGRAKKVQPETPGQQGLVFQGTEDSQLTKAQRAFNRLVRKIEKLQQEIARENRRLDKLVSTYASNVHPMEVEIVRIRREILRKLHTLFVELPRSSTSTRNRYLKLLKQQLLEHWGDLRGQLDDEFKKLFQSVMHCTPEKFLKRASKAAQTKAPRGFEDMDGDDDPIDIRSMLDEIDRKMGSQQHSGDPPETPAAARRRKVEQERLRLAEEMRTKDLSSLYKQLAKLLHPDLEQDPERRSAKEAAMKQLNAAHAARDLHAMLKMEIEWITKEGTDASHLSDQKLAVYNSVLEEQVDELEGILGNVWMHPRFHPLARFADPYFGLMVVEPGDLIADVKCTLELLEKCLEILGQKPSPKELTWLVNQLGPNKREPIWEEFGF